MTSRNVLLTSSPNHFHHIGQTILGASTGLQAISVDDGTNDFIYIVLANALNQREIYEGKLAILGVTTTKGMKYGAM